MEILEKLKKKIWKISDDAVLILDKKKENQIKFINNDITNCKSWFNQQVSVFCSIDKRILVTNLHDFSVKGVNDLVKNILKFKKNIKPKQDYYGIAEGPFKYKKINQSYDKKIDNLSDKAVDLVEKSINTSLSSGSKRCSGLLEYGSFERTLITSNNVDAKDKGTSIYFSIRSFNKEGSGHKIGCSRTLKNIKIEEMSENSALIAKDSQKPIKISPGKYDLVLDTIPIANLLNHVAHASSIASIEAGFSCLMNKMNEKVASNIFTLYDQGNLDNGHNSIKFDDEGVPTRKNTIIEKGVLKNYLYNTSYAKKYNKKTTANAGLISPEPLNIILKKKDHKKEEIIKETKHGLYITNTWYTRFQDYVKGDFSTIPRDGIFLIKNGKIKSAVKEIRLSDNLLNIIKNIKAIGNKQEQIVGWEIDTPVVTPMVLAKDINITRSTS